MGIYVNCIIYYGSKNLHQLGKIQDVQQLSFILVDGKLVICIWSI
jgi:hypothetical protein